MNARGATATMLKTGFAEAMAYRSEVFIWILSTTMPLIMYAMWSTLAAEAPVGRFDESTFAAYFLSTLIVRQLAAAWVVWELNWTIRTGALSTMLLRPTHPLYYFALQNMGMLPFRIAVLIPVVVVAWFTLPELPFVLQPLNCFLYIWTIFWAWVLTFTVQSMFGLLALYTQQSLSFQDAWFGVWSLLSGYLIPLSVVPGLQAVANWLPFRAMGSLPTEILLGHLQGAQLWQGLGAQLLWVGIVFVMIRIFWNKAIRRFEAFGG
ncbi:MAG: ABC-2 family transporter protein [Myxococcota bacterium]